MDRVNDSSMSLALHMNQLSDKFEFRNFVKVTCNLLIFHGNQLQFLRHSINNIFHAILSNLHRLPYISQMFGQIAIVAVLEHLNLTDIPCQKV